jgi:general secretion pathway protein J
VTAARRRCRDDGFTLVELLVALTLIGLVSVFLFDGIALATKGLDRLSKRADQLNERRGIEMLMRRALADTVFLPVFEDQASFVGEPRSVSFLSVVEDGGPGIYRITLAFNPDRSDRAITLSRRLAGKQSIQRSYESVLIRNVRQFELAYFGAEAAAAEAHWHPRWVGMASPPQLLRIMLDVGDDEHRPPIVLRLRHAG